MPTDTSFIKSLVPVIEAWKEVRRYGMTAERRIGIPNRIASVDAKELAALSAVVGEEMDIDAMVAYCDDLTKEQAYTDQAVAIPGVKITYPNISMPLNPWEADATLKKEIIDFFFHRDIIEATKAAITTTTGPTMDLIDIHVNSERECWGKPFEWLWNTWLMDWNGYDFVDEFQYWNWAPDDQVAIRDFELKAANSGTMLINDFRKRQGWPVYTPEQILQLQDERNVKGKILTPDQAGWGK